MDTEITVQETPQEDRAPLPSYGDPKKCDDAHKSKLKKFVDSGITYLHPYNMRRFSLDRKADEFMAANQWLEPSYSSLGTRYTSNWTRIVFDKDDPEYIPTPVFDEYSTPIQNESARLGKPDYEPYVRAEGIDPDIDTKEGARTAENALRQALRDMGWEDEQEKGLHHMPQYGQWYTYSYWDTSWDKTVRIPVDGAMQCSNPDCGFKLASRELPPDFAQQFLSQNPDKAGRIGQIPQPSPAGRPDVKLFKYHATACLQCDNAEEQQNSDANPLPLPEPENLGLSATTPDEPQAQLGAPSGEGVGPDGLPAIDTAPATPSPLKPFVGLGDELEQRDQFGRDLGEDVPLGEWKLDTLTPDEVFVSNFGINVRPGHIKEFWLCRVRQLSWIRNRFANGGLVKPEATRPLMEFHPIFGERELYQATAPKAFKQHARVKEYHRHPSKQLVLDPNTHQPEVGTDPLDSETYGKPTGRTEMDRGRSIIMANDVVLFDGDYMIESQTNPGELIGRCNLDVAIFDFRSGGREIEGVALAERLFSPCESNNEVLSMIQDTIQVQGTPKWRATRGMELDFDAAGGAGGVYIWAPDPMSPNLEPQQVENDLKSIGVLMSFLNYGRESIGRIAHMNDVEEGNVPPGVTAALALQILAEQSNEKRKPRIRRIKEMLQRQYTHGLELMHELVREPRLAWVEGDDGEEVQESWQGLDILGQTDVRIDAEPDHSSALVRQQTIRDMMGFPQFEQQFMSDARTRRLVAEELGAPRELFERYDLQDNAARREYTKFMESGEAPIVDNDLDDNESHADRHGIDCLGEQWRALERTADWNGAWKFLADWEKVYFQGNQTQQPSPDPMAPPIITGQPPLSQTYDEQQVPPALDVRIKKCWIGLLTMRGYLPPTPPDPMQVAQAQQQSMLTGQPMVPPPPGPGVPPPDLDRALTFRAHLASHIAYAKQEKEAMMAGAPVQAAPGEQATDPQQAQQAPVQA